MHIHMCVYAYIHMLPPWGLPAIPTDGRKTRGLHYMLHTEGHRRVTWDNGKQHCANW